MPVIPPSSWKVSDWSFVGSSSTSRKSGPMMIFISRASASFSKAFLSAGALKTLGSLTYPSRIMCRPALCFIDVDFLYLGFLTIFAV